MNTYSTLSLNEIVADPVGAYETFRLRIKEKGNMAPFPEFEKPIREIITALNSERFATVFEAHPALELEKHQVMIDFAHVNFNFYYDAPKGLEHPYIIPNDRPFPYRPTIDAIRHGLGLLDTLNRLEPGNRAVPFYHFDRYRYHEHRLLNDPEIIFFPICEDIGFYELLRLRSVPIGLVGVMPYTMRVDRHWQSPLDFWYHDVNHVRRMTEYGIRLCQKRNVVTEEEKMGLYRELDSYIVNKILPLIDVKELSNDDDIIEYSIRNMTQTLVFEVCHESALILTPEIIKEELLRPGGPQPFEHMVKEIIRYDSGNIEELRTPNGNIVSGISTQNEKEYRTIFVRYFYDRSLGCLATVYNKLNFGFYDDPDCPMTSVVPVNYRTPEIMLEAFKRLWSICSNEPCPDDTVVLGLINSREGSHEKFTYKGSLVDDSGTSTHIKASDPLIVQDAVRSAWSHNKKVLVFMGYSALQYENEEKMLHKAREILSQHKPEEWVVCIGATDEGIGKVYEVARELGFKTIGIVSTLALTYSGKYSKFVDDIYIVNDHRWGGYIKGTANPTDVTRAFEMVADKIVCLGGGTNTAVLIEVWKALGSKRPLEFYRFDMNHAIAKKAMIKNTAGAAYDIASQFGLVQE